MSASCLPVNWAEPQLAEVISPVSTIDPANTPDVTFTYFDISSIDSEAGLAVAPKPVLGQDAPARARQAVMPNDVMFSTVRPGLRAVAQVPQADNAVASTGFCVLRPAEGMEARYIYHFVRSEGFLQRILPLQRGVSYPAVRPADVLAQRLPLPPSAEQERIVQKIDELLSDLDEGVKELKAAQKKLTKYRQSLLKAAVEGALTANWRAQRAQQGEAFETGAQLLERILCERRARWEAKQLAKFKEQGKAPPKGWQSAYSDPSAPNIELAVEIPDGWQLASLGQLLDVLTSGSRDWSAYYGRGTCTFIMAQNVRPWRPDFSFRQQIDPPPGHRDRSRSEICRDDLLITIVGANTGQACRVAEDLEDHFVCQSVGLLRLVEPLLAEFVNAVLNSPAHGQRQFREMNYGAGRPHLSFDQIGAVLIPLPPLAEQKVILELLASSMAVVSDLEGEVRYLGRCLAAQHQNLLKSAFSGQLVPQDPADEPASILLERIRAERAAQAAQLPTKNSRRPKAAVETDSHDGA